MCNKNIKVNVIIRMPPPHPPGQAHTTKNQNFHWQPISRANVRREVVKVLHYGAQGLWIESQKYGVQRWVLRDGCLPDFPHSKQL